jgi:dTDP-4-amino-4,6-dideoxygalactose transaminase
MEEIKLSKSIIGQDEIDAVVEVLKREYLGMGQEVQQLESAFSSFFLEEMFLALIQELRLYILLFRQLV